MFSVQWQLTCTPYIEKRPASFLKTTFATSLKHAFCYCNGQLQTIKMEVPATPGDWSHFPFQFISTPLKAHNTKLQYTLPYHYSNSQDDKVWSIYHPTKPTRDNKYILIVSLRTTTLLHDAFWPSHDDTNFDKGAGRPNEISQRSMSLLRFHRTHGKTPKIHDPARNACTKTSNVLIKTALYLPNDEDVQNGPTSSKCLH